MAVRDQRVTVQRQVNVADGAGGSTSTWEVVCVLWASVVAGAGREFWEQKQVRPQLSHVVNIRYRGTVTPAMRVLHGVHVLVVAYVADPNGRRTEENLYCEEEVAT